LPVAQTVTRRATEHRTFPETNERPDVDNFGKTLKAEVNWTLALFVNIFASRNPFGILRFR
jgi:hypothetical protein